jgi:nucleotide-binding universal stress UspA family protein
MLAHDATYNFCHAPTAPFEGLTGGRASDYPHDIKRETEEDVASWSRSMPSDLPKVELTHDGAGLSPQTARREIAPDLIAVGATTRGMSLAGLGSFTVELVRDPPADILIARGAKSK